MLRSVPEWNRVGLRALLSCKVRMLGIGMRWMMGDLWVHFIWVKAPIPYVILHHIKHYVDMGFYGFYNI